MGVACHKACTRTRTGPRCTAGRIELVVRLVRSKGVGVYFVTQNPLDVPDSVLGQLGNRVQHALRAFTPRDQKAVRSAASTMRPNPGLDLEAAITELADAQAVQAVQAAEAAATARAAEERASSRSTASARGGSGMLEVVARSAVRSMGTSIGRQIVRGVLGGLLGGGRRR
jgi:hypothetical protein